MKRVGIFTLFALVLTGIAAALILFEIIVRTFFEEPIMPRYVMDTGFGVRAHQPNITTRHFMPGDYDIIISTNSTGMRGARDYNIDKPDRVYRIALIGDSFVFGHGVNDDEVVSAVLEASLNETVTGNPKKYEVLNFGVSGFGQAEELITYRHRVRHYDPDMVVLFYFNNDFGNNAVSNLFEVDGSGELVRKNNEYLPGVHASEVLYGIAPIRWLFENSQGWNLIRNRLSALVQKTYLKKQGLKSYSDSSNTADILTRRLLLELVNEIREDNARPVVFVIPHKGLESNFPLETNAVTASGAEFVDGRKYLSSEHYHNRDSHWNAGGHKVAAAILNGLVAGR